MSYKRNHANVSTGGAGSQISSPSSVRRPSAQSTYFKRESSDTASPHESKSRRSPSDDAESDASSDHIGRTRKKAEPVKSACVQCQKRKTKCSGQRPVCRFCSDRNLECSWDIGDGLTRTADLKQKLYEATQKSDELSDLVGAMRTGTDQTSSMLLAKLRLGCLMEELLANVRLDESSGEGNQGHRDSQMTARRGTLPATAGTDYSSPTSPGHQLDWPQSGPQYHHVQPNESRMNNANLHCYQNNNQQPYFATPNFDQSQMTWPRHHSYHSENNALNNFDLQGFNNTQIKDEGTSPGPTMVRRNTADAFPTQPAAAHRGSMTDM